MSKIIIVESSAKIKTITRFLRGEYKVIASGGHIADLPKHTLGINIDDFTFDIQADQNKLNKMKKQLEGCEEVYLATDPDREGEGIPNDIFKLCELHDKKVYRIKFNAIVYHAIVEAFEKKGEIDRNLVAAQNARRVLDRLIGFILSPIAKFDPVGPKCPERTRTSGTPGHRAFTRSIEAALLRACRAITRSAGSPFHSVCTIGFAIPARNPAQRRAVRQLPLLASRVPGVTMNATGVAREVMPMLNEIDALSLALRESREYTLSMYAHLERGQWRVPLMDIVNPPLWEIAHIGFFQEFFSRRWRPDDPAGALTPPRLAGADSLFDSRTIAHDRRHGARANAHRSVRVASRHAHPKRPTPSRRRIAARGTRRFG